MSELETIAKWMIANSLATGHGDTVDDLLAEAAWQIGAMREAIATQNGVVVSGALKLNEARARVKELEAWATEWHETAETICLLAGVSQGLGAGEMVVAFRDTNDALRARVAKLEAALRQARPFVNMAVTQEQAEASPRWHSKAVNALVGIDAALSGEPTRSRK